MTPLPPSLTWALLRAAAVTPGRCTQPARFLKVLQRRGLVRRVRALCPIMRLEKRHAWVPTWRGKAYLRAIEQGTEGDDVSKPTMG